MTLSILCQVHSQRLPTLRRCSLQEYNGPVLPPTSVQVTFMKSFGSLGEGGKTINVLNIKVYRYRFYGFAAKAYFCNKLSAITG